MGTLAEPSLQAGLEPALEPAFNASGDGGNAFPAVKLEFLEELVPLASSTLPTTAPIVPIMPPACEEEDFSVWLS
eukprot:JP443353.1.p2 GENE.JP443353.1~~JP443353.1.p2  ORF type:complete len:75 (+),score=20.23 JP443353.1:1-225(+)